METLEKAKKREEAMYETTEEAIKDNLDKVVECKDHKPASSSKPRLKSNRHWAHDSRLQRLSEEFAEK
jgi:Mn-dependent DtxR family transcriptional regulator